MGRRPSLARSMPRAMLYPMIGSVPDLTLKLADAQERSRYNPSELRGEAVRQGPLTDKLAECRGRKDHPKLGQQPDASSLEVLICPFLLGFLPARLASFPGDCTPLLRRKVLSSGLPAFTTEHAGGVLQLLSG